jgi:hypothetical protein
LNKKRPFGAFLMTASEAEIAADKGMALALKSAEAALANNGTDPSNGAYWWDGLDFKTNYGKHPKVSDGFHFGSPTHNIFDVQETSHEITLYWKVRDKKTGKEVNSKVRGSCKYVWESTAAYGKTIFWKHDAEYLTATGGKAYR